MSHAAVPEPSNAGPENSIRPGSPERPPLVAADSDQAHVDHDWKFYLRDEDRSTGWSKQTYVLQHVRTGAARPPSWLGGTPWPTIRSRRALTLRCQPTVAISAHHETPVAL
jgi:hypothetical protein